MGIRHVLFPQEASVLSPGWKKKKFHLVLEDIIGFVGPLKGKCIYFPLDTSQGVPFLHVVIFHSIH